MSAEKQRHCQESNHRGHDRMLILNLSQMFPTGHWRSLRTLGWSSSPRRSFPAPCRTLSCSSWTALPCWRRRWASPRGRSRGGTSREEAPLSIPSPLACTGGEAGRRELFENVGTVWTYRGICALGLATQVHSTWILLSFRVKFRVIQKEISAISSKCTCFDTFLYTEAVPGSNLIFRSPTMKKLFGGRCVSKSGQCLTFVMVTHGYIITVPFSRSIKYI